MTHFPSRRAVIALATPSLRSILIRALHPTPSSYAGGPRTQSRGAPSVSAIRKTIRMPQALPEASPRSARSPKKTSFGLRPQSAQSQPEAAPATSRRLSPLPPPSRRDALPYYSHLPSGSKYPSSQPYKPTTYPPPQFASPADLALSSPRPFSAFPLNPLLLQSMQDKFGEEGQTTAIQSLALSTLLSDKKEKVLLGAETGSGKTLAYLLPLLHHLKATDRFSPSASPNSDVLAPRAIVLSPTHELTRQSTNAAKALAHGIKLSVKGLSSTSSGVVGRGNVDVLFGTGASLRRAFGLPKVGEEEVERRGSLDMERIEWIVIDEADVLLGPDFQDETLSLLTHLSAQNPSLVLVTATLPPSLLSHPLLTSTPPILKLLSPQLHKLPKSLQARFVPPSGSGNLFADVIHETRRVFAEDALLAKQLSGTAQGQTHEEKSRIVVFCNTENKVRGLEKAMQEKSIECLAWTGEAAQRERGTNGLLNPFLSPSSSPLDPANPLKSSTSSSHSQSSQPTSARILITTSLLSRGLDFSAAVSTVFLVDQPRDILDFVHRAGRAGRAGRKGRVVVFGMGEGKEGGRLGKGLKEVVGRKRELGNSVRAGGRVRMTK
ncbi:hypothetical protein P7C73_g3515, partial [Tremellales sp. Uapishka_1]